MFKYTVTEYQQCPPSLGGNWDSGTYTRVCFSNSPKKATSFRGEVSSRFTGVDGCPIMERRTLERNGKVIFDIWDWRNSLKTNDLQRWDPVGVLSA